MATPTGPFTAQEIANACLPGEKPKAMRVRLNFADADEYIINLENEVSQKRIKSVQTLFIDNAANPAHLVINVDITRQRIVVPPRSQGYYPILAGSPPVFTVRGAVVIVNIHMINVPMPAVVWDAEINA